MQWSKTLTMVEAHAEGEVGRVITGGVLDLPGKTMLDKMNALNQVDDTLRRFCVFEPRGCAQMSTNVILPPTRDDADIGFIIMQSDKAHAMSGSNAICVVTVALETGLLSMREPETTVRRDTPAGLVVAMACCRNGKCEQVGLDMTPAFAEVLDARLEVRGIGKVTVDIAFGGVYYALVDPESVGLTIEPKSARALVEAGSRIHRAVNEQISFAHPELPELSTISYVMFVGYNADRELVGATILPPGRIDRSPCGTGNTARLAVRYARGEATIGEQRTAYSIIGSHFNVSFRETTVVTGRPAVKARISGRAWIHGIHQIRVDPSDPFPQCFLLADCWGDAFDLWQ